MVLVFLFLDSSITCMNVHPHGVQMQRSFVSVLTHQTISNSQRMPIRQVGIYQIQVSIEIPIGDRVVVNVFRVHLC